jgi:hypothetical protein
MELTVSGTGTLEHLCGILAMRMIIAIGGLSVRLF